MLKKFAFLLVIFLFFGLISPVSAVENNKFGIHVTQTEDLTKAAELVNTNNGDWGYVTIVIQENDRSREKWQGFFDLCREKHLIPLVRLGTHLNGDIWEKPTLESMTHWADFLDSLNWPVRTQYVIVFNEPNHAKEWGGEVNPDEYVLILDQALTVFKQKNQNFFVLNAGLDQAAPNSKATMEESRFLRTMESKVPGIFSRLDGWASHSYPNHGFVGKPWESGQATIRGYEWELAILKSNFRFSKDLPVFITETGWPHGEKFYDSLKTAEFIKQAFEKIWLDDRRVVAITPFILNYPFAPFESFSWLDFDGNPYLQYQEIQKMEKIKGEPIQIQKYEIKVFEAWKLTNSKETLFNRIFRRILILRYSLLSQ